MTMPDDHWQTFRPLTDAQRERLAMLAEEAGEIAQAAGKALRHGLECCHPATGEINSFSIAKEVTDLVAVAKAMISAGDLPSKCEAPEIHDTDEAWRKKLEYAHFQKDAE